MASPTASVGEVEHSSEVEMTTEAQTRLRWFPIYLGEGIPYRCSHCHLVKDDHVRVGAILYCAEWRLRQMWGDR